MWECSRSVKSQRPRAPRPSTVFPPRENLPRNKKFQFQVAEFRCGGAGLWFHCPCPARSLLRHLQQTVMVMAEYEKNKEEKALAIYGDTLQTMWPSGGRKTAALPSPDATTSRASLGMAHMSFKLCGILTRVNAGNLLGPNVNLNEACEIVNGQFSPLAKCHLSHRSQSQMLPSE